jgi:hypothetical protein
MSAVSMMLKSLGIEINPDEIIEQVNAMGRDIAEMRASIARTEALSRENNSLLLKLLANVKESENV